MHIPLSVVIITFNEEKNIGRCLESVKDVADEIVVVDSFSTDRTEEICHEFGVRFVKHPFEGHIQQKNYAITQAKYPHILSLDADEALSDELKASILLVKNNWEIDGYKFNRLTYYSGRWIKHCGWYPDQKLRLWDSRKGAWGGENPHDKFIMNKSATIGHIKGDLLHYSFYNIAQHVHTINNFSNIWVQVQIKKGKKYSFLKLIFSPFFTFIKVYFIKLGFLDGMQGLSIALSGSYSRFLRQIKLYEAYSKKV